MQTLSIDAGRPLHRRPAKQLELGRRFAADTTPREMAAIPPQSRMSHVYSPVTLTERPADIGVSVSDTTISPPEQLAPATPELASSDLARMVAEVSTERSKPGWASFNLELNDDQVEIRDWVH